MAEEKHRQFIKSVYINKKNTTDKSDKVLIVSKDETGKNYIDVVEKPKIQYSITKPEYWDGVTHNYIESDKVRKVTALNKNKDKSIVKELNDPSITMMYDQLMSSGNFEDYKRIRDIQLDYRVHGSDINIEDQYIAAFLSKYPTDKVEAGNYFGIHKAFYDIEVDIDEIVGFPEPEEALAPVNIITYVDLEKKVSYTYCLKYDNDSYRETMADLANIYIYLEKRYKEKGLDLEFKIMEFDDEVELIGTFLYHVNEEFRPDFLSA